MEGSAREPGARLFVALELPDEARGALTAWAAAALERRPGIRLVAPGALHVTLCFIGSRPVSELDAIGAAVRSVVAGVRRPIRLRLDTPLLLPRGRPRVVAVRLVALDPARGAAASSDLVRGDTTSSDPACGATASSDSTRDRPTALDALHAELSARLVAGGWYRPERRPFVAHVTVARVGARAQIALSQLPAPPDGSITASAVTLFRSYTDPGGARYVPLVRSPLER